MEKGHINVLRKLQVSILWLFVFELQQINKIVLPI